MVVALMAALTTGQAEHGEAQVVELGRSPAVAYSVALVIAFFPSEVSL
jgi:hypothetical protein